MRLNVSEALEKVLSPDFGRQYLFVLSQSTYELIASILDQVEWDVSGSEQKDLYEKAQDEIKDMANLQQLLNILQDMVDALGEIREGQENANACMCEGFAQQVAVAQYDLPPDYEGINPDYLSGAEFNENSTVPEPIRNQGYEGWEGWQSYVCKAVELVRRASLRTSEELLQVMDTPAITLGLIAAVFGALAAIFVSAGTVTLVLAPALMASIGSALIVGGQTCVEAAIAFLSDGEGIHWREMACIIKTSLTSQEAKGRIIDYIEQHAAPVAVPVLSLYPWESWINQVYMGANTEGQDLSVQGIESLCAEDCGQWENGFRGTAVTDCGLVWWENTAYCRLYEGGESCTPGDDNPPFVEFGDGIYGRYSGEPPSATSANFQVQVTGTYKLRYRMAGYAGETGDGTIRIYDAGDNLIAGLAVYPDNLTGDEQLTTDFQLEVGVSYYMTLLMGKFFFECYNSSLELQP